MQTVSAAEALRNRRRQFNPNSGKVLRRTPFIGCAGTRDKFEVRDAAMALLVEMTMDSVLPAHFHQVDQFQVFVSGLHIHYTDRHTACGPITGRPHSVAYFTLRAKKNARGMFLNKPSVRELLIPSKKRFRLSDTVVLSAAPALAERTEHALEPLFPADDAADDLGAFALRLGTKGRMRGLDPAGIEGQYYLVVTRTLQQTDTELPPCSLLWTFPGEDTPAGINGAKIVMTHFPQPD